MRRSSALWHHLPRLTPRRATAGRPTARASRGARSRTTEGTRPAVIAAPLSGSRAMTRPRLFGLSTRSHACFARPPPRNARLRQPGGRPKGFDASPDAQIMRGRDRLIREALAIFYREHSRTSSARTLAIDLRRYCNGAWPREACLPRLPDGASSAQNFEPYQFAGCLQRSRR